MNDEIPKVIKQINDNFDKELFSKTCEELETYWHFKYDNQESKEHNLYEFTQLLELYRHFCRRWEEQHNGYVCVVGRVRDKYLMPKIKQFIEDVSR